MRPQALHSVPPGSPAYEKRDISVRAVLWVGLSVAALLIVVGVFLYWLLGFLAAGQPVLKADYHPSALPMSAPPPAPQLQTNDRADYAAYRSEKLHQLESGGVGPDGRAHIPIAQAIEILTTRGLPARGDDRGGEKP